MLINENNEAIDKRLTDLEIKASFTEDMVDELNQAIVRQQLQIDLLLRELGQLRQQGEDAAAGGFRSLRDELPPHY
jgi:SlyX protein